MLKLKLQYFGCLMQRADSFENTLMLEDWRQEEKRTTEDDIIGGLRELVMDREAWCAVVLGVTKTRMSDWTELNYDAR